ncbi:MAG: hypothetical protein KDC34_01370 [Saprospiraceae bacterium]|nr:hypothetical protein [Saprospiraceae bacterium]
MEFSDILQGLPDFVQEIATNLRALVRPLHPDIQEDLTKTRTMAGAFYSIGSKSNVIIFLQPGDAHCKLYLHHTDKIDTRGLPLQGKGKHAKHIKLFEWDPALEDTYRLVLTDITRIVAEKA